MATPVPRGTVAEAIRTVAPLNHVRADITHGEAKDVVRAIFEVIAQFVLKGEVDDIVSMLPEGVRDLSLDRQLIAARSASVTRSPSWTMKISLPAPPDVTTEDYPASEPT
jgi:hypothetical protein